MRAVLDTLKNLNDARVEEGCRYSIRDCIQLNVTDSSGTTNVLVEVKSTGKSNRVTSQTRRLVLHTVHVAHLFFISACSSFVGEGKSISQTLNSSKGLHVNSSWTVLVSRVLERTGDIPFALVQCLLMCFSSLRLL